MQNFVIDRDRHSRAFFESRFRLTPRSWYSYAANKTGHKPWSEAKPFYRSAPSQMDLRQFMLSLEPIHALISEAVDARTIERAKDALDTLCRMNARFDRWTSMTVEGGDAYDISCLGFFFTTKEDATMFRMAWGD